MSTEHTAEDETYTYTVCGLHVDQDKPENWSGGTWTVEALDADFAVNLVRTDVKGQTPDDPSLNLIVVDLALACVHLGDIERVGRIECAVETVTVGELDDVDTGELLLFTVCGVDRRTWRTLCYQVEGPHWLHAYTAARDLAAKDGYELLHAATHPGWVDRVEGYDWASATAGSAGAMRQVATEWGVS